MIGNSFNQLRTKINLLYQGFNYFNWLERAYDEHDAYLPFIISLSEDLDIISDPRYKALLKKMGLPED